MRTLFHFLILVTPVLAGPVTVGAGRVEITPARGTPMAGYYSTRLLEGVLDPLYATALVFEKDGVKAAYVSLDLLTTTPAMTSESRALIAAKLGIPKEHVMISATHTHTGPVLSDKMRDVSFGGSSKLAQEYRAALPGKILDAVVIAESKRQPVTIQHSVGKEEGLAFNRRYHLNDGTVGWNPGKKNPKIVKPAGPTDDAVSLLVFESLNKVPVACLVNFAMHSDTTGGMYASADYPGHLRKLLSTAKGENLVSSFALGCCGDVNHINVNLADAQKGAAESSRIGTRLAAATLKAWDERVPIADGPLKVSREIVTLPLPEVTHDEEMAALKVQLEVNRETKPAPKFLDQVQAFKVLDVTSRMGKRFEVEVQVISFGPDLAIVSLPGEIFTQLGLDIKKASPFKTTIIAELANGSLGYIPNKAAYPQGQYEVLSARCAAGSGEKLVESAVKQLKEHFAK
ncbi:neutral/alkaline non-lysosomal ceramidase N-terminal domain-containing protein [soil metagenome]